MLVFSFIANLKRIFHYRVQSGVLQLTLGISLIIAILCSAMIMLVYYSKLSFLQQDINRRLRDNALSGIQYGMAGRSGAEFSTPELLDLFGEENDSVEVSRQPWGVFEVISSRAFTGRHTVTKAAFITALPDKIGKSVLYMPDNNAPVYLAGKTFIRGAVYAAERKFSTGYIDGKDFEGERLVHGTVLRSDPLMPLLDSLLIHQVKSIFNNQQNAYHLTSQNLFPRGKRSFDQPSTHYYHSNQSIEISDSLSGNIIIHSTTKIQINSNAVVSDIIMIAPTIEIEDGFRGNLQCFATKRITVGAKSVLEYPSALVLMGKESDSTIVIRRDAIVNGLVIIQGYDQVVSSPGVFKVEKAGRMHGMAYINGAADIQGQFWGHIMTRAFQVSLPGPVVYGNHIFNGEIDIEKQSPHMPASLLWARTKDLVVAKWIE